MSADVISDDPEVQAHYEKCIDNGCSHRLAEVLATRTFPGTRGTDRAFMEGRHLDGSQFEGLPVSVGREYLQKALVAGVNPTGKYYSGPLARFPGDPRAWIDGLGDVRRIAAERGVEVSGAVDFRPPVLDPPSPGPYRVAEDIIEDEVDWAIAEEPELAPRRADLVEELAEKRSGLRR